MEKKKGIENIAILSLVMLAVIEIAFLALTAQNMNMPGTNPGPASPGSIEQFNYLNQQVSRCLWGANMGDEMGYTNWMDKLGDDTYIQGPAVTLWSQRIIRIKSPNFQTILPYRW